MSTHLYPVPSGAAVGDGAPADNVASEIPRPLAKLTAKEKALWEHVTQALQEYGLIHLTDAMTITVICRTFARWVDTEEQLTKFAREHGGSYIVKTPNGYEQPHQLFYAARTLKRELLSWLPEAALTIPSFQKVMGERAFPGQPTLPGIEDPVEAHRRRRVAAGLRSV
ncbi:P27 family phage terminase small subunit [Paracandidimonas soli]|uniref:Phage terminase small subunit n=1 Tax=Paracandidimonas soli TaxID=1917182 RepID=A0A4R3V2B8_9BURK|nr:P27 family phage terminase small subunit [Paracandidimonas soli]TCU97307.1 phage terminase small subunit [Paracandidimonas soli]